jgi:hypothetical protein
LGELDYQIKSTYNITKEGYKGIANPYKKLAYFFEYIGNTTGGFFDTIFDS